jgi:thymidylate synthase
MIPKLNLILTTDKNYKFMLNEDLEFLSRIISVPFTNNILVIDCIQYNINSNSNSIDTVLITNENNNNYKCYESLENFLNTFQNNINTNIYIYGSLDLINLCLTKYKNIIKKVYYTMYTKEIISDDPLYISDSFIEEIKNNTINIITTDKMIHYMLEYKEHEEYQYLNLLNKCLTSGDYRQTRNSLTYSNFGDMLTFDLTKGFPLITTKKVFIRGIFEELMFFLRGQTDSKILEKKGVNIWAPNTSDEFIKANNLPYKQGDMGPLYGFNWNHFGANYVDCNTNYMNQGFNQIEYILDSLLNDIHSRRIIMTDFNPSCAKQGVLYPCHSIVIQFYVRKVKDDNMVSMTMYQRSADAFLGLCYNISSSALLLHLVCQTLNSKINKFNYIPDKLHLYLGDIHIYNDHLDAVKEQLKRIPFDFPTINITKIENDIKKYEWSDIVINNYNCHSIIKAPMIS